MTPQLLIFSHTDYSHLWPVIEEYVSKIPELNPIFVCNYQENPPQKPKGFVEYIEYNSELCYSQRWVQDICPKINSKYILVAHDVQIIVNCDAHYIQKIAKTMDENNIDRCSMHVFAGQQILHVSDCDLSICNLNTANGNTNNSYDVCPAIWNTESLRQLFTLFPKETYNSSEYNEDLIQYCKNNMIFYGIQKSPNKKIQFSLGRPCYDICKILYITIKGEFTFPKEVYMDMLPEFEYIVNKYDLYSKIKINDGYGFIFHRNYKELYY
jgi:hypothetical protein